MKDTQVTIDSETHNEDKVQLSNKASEFYHDTISTLHKVKECTERIQELFAIMSSMIKESKSRCDLVKPFDVVCDKFMVSVDEKYPLSCKNK